MRVSGEGKRRGEFQLIAELFAPLTRNAPGALNLTDDAALLEVTPGCELVTTVDTLIAGVHFFETDPPDLVARKALRVNLSDVAAKGARPVGFLQALALHPSIHDAYLEKYAAGLAADVREFDVPLLGGDTTSGPGPLSITITAFGEVEKGKALLRRGARAGDVVYVTGTIGDAALALDFQLGLFEAERAVADAFIQRYRLPVPRLREGRAIIGIASACLDVSDGLVADIGHLCKASGVAATIERECVPVSTGARALLDRDPHRWERVLTGGDDYELVFTVPPSQVPQLTTLSMQFGFGFTRIGQIERAEDVKAGSDVTVLAGGTSMTLTGSGYRHR